MAVDVPPRFADGASSYRVPLRLGQLFLHGWILSLERPFPNRAGPEIRMHRNVTCSPKSGPGAMRVSGAPRGQRRRPMSKRHTLKIIAKLREAEADRAGG